MSSTIRRMPGVNCTHYVCGKCLFSERLNPGHELSMRCDEVSRLVKAYDLMLEQVDTFTLRDEDAREIWTQRLAAMPAAGDCCEFFRPSGGCSGGCNSCSDGDEPSHDQCGVMCVYIYDTACVLKMPMCDGVCNQYKHRA